MQISKTPLLSPTDLESSDVSHSTNYPSMYLAERAETKESLCSRISRYVACIFLGITGYVGLYPSIELSGAWPAGQAAIICFGTFNYICIYHFCLEAFSDDLRHATEKMVSTCTKVMIVIFSLMLGMASRLPSAGVTFLIQDFTQSQKIGWALLSLVATFGPEALAALRTFKDSLLLQDNHRLSRDDRLLGEQLRHNLIKHIEILQEEEGDIDNSDLYNSLLNQNIHQLVKQKMETQIQVLDASKSNPLQFRKVISFCISSFSGSVFMFLNILLTKIAFENLFPETSKDEWTIPTATLVSLIFSHVLYSVTYTTSYNLQGIPGRLCKKNMHEMTFSEKTFPKTAFLYNCFAMFESGCLFWVMKAEVESLRDTDPIGGMILNSPLVEKPFLASATTAIFLLVYNAMREVFEQVIEGTTIRIGMTKNNYLKYYMLKNFKNKIDRSTIKAFCQSLLNHQLTEDQYRMLTYLDTSLADKDVPSLLRQLVADQRA